MNIIGVDEVGRGCIAGPVFAAAVLWKPEYNIEGLKDSKLLSPKRREKIKEIMDDIGVYYFTSSASIEEIDKLNIRVATLLAMKRCIDGLNASADIVLIDGFDIISDLHMEQRAIKGGDNSEPSISAASIIAKLKRDDYCQDMDLQYPGYEVNIHKGYPTKRHLFLLEELGPSPMHRKTFKPVSTLITYQE